MSNSELQKLQQQLRIEIQCHQILVVKVQADPHNSQLKKSIHEQQKRITALSEKQKKVVEQLRSQLEVRKNTSQNDKNNDDSEGSEGTSDEEDVPELDQIEEEENIEPAEMDSDLFQITELKSSNTTPLGTSQHLNIPSRPSMKACFKAHHTTQGPGGGSPPLTPPRMSILTNKPTTFPIKVPQITCRLGSTESKITFSKQEPPAPVVKKHRVISAYESHRPKRALTIEEKKLEFMASLGLITQKTLEHLQNKKQERKRRSTANPQFSSYNRKELESRQSASSYIAAAAASNWVDENVKRARLADPEPPISNTTVHTKPPPETVTLNGKPDNHEDVCAVCRKSGELLCCDSCHLVYHLSCLDPPLSARTPGVWSCPQCKAHISAEQWQGTLAVVHSYLGHKNQKEEEKRKLVKRATELWKERLALEERVKQLNTAITKKKTASEELMKAYRRTEDAVERIKEFITLIQT